MEGSAVQPVSIIREDSGQAMNFVRIDNKFLASLILRRMPRVVQIPCFSVSFILSGGVLEFVHNPDLIDIRHELQTYELPSGETVETSVVLAEERRVT